MERNRIVQSDALNFLSTLPDACVNCCVTSPPYYALRDYGVQGQIGLEDTPHAFIARLVELFGEVRRVLRSDGVAWVNMGDSYIANKHTGSYGLKIGSSHTTDNVPNVKHELPEKNLLGMPWRLALALQDDGWILRSDIIWHKLSCMPESVTDRPTKSHEYVFLLAKSPRYWYDSEAIREPATDDSIQRAGRAVSDHHKYLNVPGQTLHSLHKARANGEGYPVSATRNKRTVWTLASEPNSDAHYATFPQALIEPMILAGCPDKCCAQCGMPYERIVERTVNVSGGVRNSAGHKGLDLSNRHGGYPRATLSTNTIGFCPTCTCNAPTLPGICLDPFMGSGTTALVTRRLGRDYIGCDLNPDYVAMAHRRLAQSDPLQDREIAPGYVQRSLFSGSEVT